jgi:xylan 1,4-beta-xylosidase
MVFSIMRNLKVWVLLAGFFMCGSAGGEATYSNPVLVDVIHIENRNWDLFPGTFGIGDPDVIFYKNTYYLYPTGDNRGYDVYTSGDLIHWNKGPRVFRTDKRNAWAPDVFYNSGDQTFYLYYTVDRRVGVAAADRPDGTFRDRRTLIRNAIDAHMFMDEDGRYYLYYAEYPAFRISVQPMETPVTKKGGPVFIIRPDAPWEKRPYPLTEAPWMIKHGGTYYLLYSGGGADSQDYAIGYATAGSPLGPFTKYPGNPIMKKGNGVFGPGHASVIRDREGNFWMVYHQQKDASKGWNRIICIDPIRFDENGVLHVRATRGEARPAPVTSGR